MEKYTLKENQNLEDKSNAIIVVTNATREFTLGEMNYNINNIKKVIKELSANASLQKAIADNVLENNKELIESLTDEQMHAISMYFNAKKLLKEHSENLKKADEVLGLELKDLEKIYIEIPELKEEASAEVIEEKVN